LWYYDLRKGEDKTQNDDEASMRNVMKIGITEDIEVLEV